MLIPHNKVLQPTGKPLRWLPAVVLGRYIFSINKTVYEINKKQICD